MQSKVKPRLVLFRCGSVIVILWRGGSSCLDIWGSMSDGERIGGVVAIELPAQVLAPADLVERVRQLRDEFFRGHTPWVGGS